MNKLKVLILCAASTVLGAVLTFGLSHVKIKTESQLIIKGTTNIAKGDIADLSAEVSNPSWFLSNTIIQWKVLHNNGVVNYHSATPNEIFFPAGVNDGKFWVVTSAVVHNDYILWSDVIPLDVVVTPVTVGTPTPGPGPIPPVPPGPTPQPVTSPLWAITIFDNNNPLTLTGDQLTVHNGTEDMVTSLKPFTVTYRNYDKSSPAMTDPSWQALVNEVGLPALAIVDEKGKVFYKGKLVSKDDIIKQVSTVRGK